MTSEQYTPVTYSVIELPIDSAAAVNGVSYHPGSHRKYATALFLQKGRTKPYSVVKHLFNTSDLSPGKSGAEKKVADDDSARRSQWSSSQPELSDGASSPYNGGCRYPADAKTGSNANVCDR